jgi:phosphoribosylaminoimidazole-succinocarboxamide synthase
VLDRSDLQALLGEPRRGKVRDVYDLPDGSLLLVASDRLSAFDVILGCVPGKGQLLTEISTWWFEQLAPIIAHHQVATVDPNAIVGRRCTTLPIEVVVRGYLTGVTSTALWPRYRDGARELYGLRLPDGLQFNDPLPEPLITPTTKATDGHDEPVSSAEVVSRGLVDPVRWEEVQAAALALFRRGSELAAAAGLTLVDTKYEFGLDDGRLTLIDEVHTPDSSRFWLRSSGENLDKELVRRWYADHGYRGDGPPPPLPADLAVSLAAAYQEVHRRLTGRPFVPAEEPEGPRLERNVSAWLRDHPSGPPP